MRMLRRLIAPPATVAAHCDLPCGIYDPAQARVEAESVHSMQKKYQENDDHDFRARALMIKEQRADLCKHHLWVLWTDYFKPPHLEKYPNLHDLFWRATKMAGSGGADGLAGTKASNDPKTGEHLLELIDEIAKIFWETKKG